MPAVSSAPPPFNHKNEYKYKQKRTFCQESRERAHGRFINFFSCQNIQEVFFWTKPKKDIDPERLVFLDETSANCGMARLYGRAMSNERVYDYVPDVRFKRTGIVSTVRLNGDIAYHIFAGSVWFMKRPRGSILFSFTRRAHMW